jgi:hypothetical protein
VADRPAERDEVNPTDRDSGKLKQLIARTIASIGVLKIPFEKRL